MIATPDVPPSAAAPARGLLLFAHGARDPAWAQPFEAVARTAASADPGCRVALAYLEFMDPDLPDAAAAMVRAGCTQVDVVPLFLGAGGHVRKDLPVLMHDLRTQWPGVRWRLHRAVGEMPGVVAALAQAACELASAADDAPTVVGGFTPDGLRQPDRSAAAPT